MCKETIYEKKDRAAADVYSMIVDFLKTGRYSSYRKANELSKMILSGCTSQVIASQLGISEATVRNHTMSVSNELYRLFGQNFFDKLANYSENKLDVDTVMYRIKHLDKTAVSYILSDTLSAIRSQAGLYSYDYNIKDCSNEVDFLRRYSRMFMVASMERVDVRKLSYILDILDGKCGTPEDWNSLVSILTEEGL